MAGYSTPSASSHNLAEYMNKLAINNNTVHNSPDDKAETMECRRDPGGSFSENNNNNSHEAEDIVCSKSSGNSFDDSDGGAPIACSDEGGIYIQPPHPLVSGPSNARARGAIPTPPSASTKNQHALPPVQSEAHPLEDSAGDDDGQASTSDQVSEITMVLSPVDEEPQDTATKPRVPTRLVPFTLHPGKMRPRTGNFVPAGRSTKPANISTLTLLRTPTQAGGMEQETGKKGGIQAPRGTTLFPIPEHTENLKHVGEKGSAPRTNIRPPPGFGPIGQAGYEQTVPYSHSNGRVILDGEAHRGQDASENHHATLDGELMIHRTVPNHASSLTNSYGLPVTCHRGAEATNLPSNTTRESYHISELLSLKETGAIPRNFEYTTTMEKLDQAAGLEDKQKGILNTATAPSWLTGLASWRDIRQQDASRPQQTPQTIEQILGTGPQPALLSYNPSNGGASPAHQPPAGRAGFNRPFEPMECLQSPPTAGETLTQDEIVYRLQKGISLNYKGQSHNLNNISHDIPHSENAALWLTNLPPTVTVKELLGVLASHGPIGRVWSLHINPPKGRATPLGNNNNNEQMGEDLLPLSHRTSAAKLIFCHPLEAQRLLALTNSGTLTLLGHHHSSSSRSSSNARHYQVHATHNRQRTPAQRIPAHISRVLVIAGPPWLVSEQQLHGIFRQYFVYQTEAVVVLAEDRARQHRVLEWRFGSIRAQAQAAFRLLTGPGMEGIVTVRWGRDPCAGAGAVPVPVLGQEEQGAVPLAGSRSILRRGVGDELDRGYGLM